MKKTPTQFKTNVGNCARCGGNHDVLLFRKLRRPVVAPDREWTHWASCPENGEPILLRRDLAAKDAIATILTSKNSQQSCASGAAMETQQP